MTGEKRAKITGEPVDRFFAIERLARLT